MKSRSLLMIPPQLFLVGHDNRTSAGNRQGDFIIDTSGSRLER